MSKCAIYNRYSVPNQNKMDEMRTAMVNHCKSLGISDYVLFEEIGSVLEKREQFDEMMSRIQNREFTDLIVMHPDRLYKATYDSQKFSEIIATINKNVTIHSVKKENDQFMM